MVFFITNKIKNVTKKISYYYLIDVKFLVIIISPFCLSFLPVFFQLQWKPLGKSKYIKKKLPFKKDAALKNKQLLWVPLYANYFVSELVISYFSLNVVCT